MAKNHETWDHLSALEVAHLDEGQYKLSIGIPKGHWFLQKSIKTCLSLDLMMEYIRKDKDWASDNEEFTESAEGPVQILTIFPPSSDDLELGEKLNMMIHLDREVDFRETAHQLTGLS